MKERINSTSESTRPSVKKLTNVEKEIVSLRAQGYSNKELGDKLIPPLKEGTVKGHTKTIFAKYKRRSFKSVMLDAYRNQELNVRDVTREMEIDQSRFGALSNQQRRVLNVFINSATSGLPHGNKDIANALFISENTVKSHLRKIYQKTDTKNIVQAITGYIAWRLDQQSKH